MNFKLYETITVGSRRRFLKWFWRILGIVASVELVAVFVSFFKPSPDLGKNNTYQRKVIEAGQVNDFEPGSVTAFVRGRFYLVRLPSGGFLAVSSQCTHLGCSIPWDNNQKRFICPCHASHFDITGKVLSSPAPRPLDLFLIQITNNNIFVDASVAIRRDNYHPDQVIFPDEIKVSSSPS